MLFNSFFFILIFMPLMLAGWYTLNHFHMYLPAEFFLILMSIWFYGSFGIKFLFILLFQTIIGYFISLMISHFGNRRIFLFVSVVFELGILFIFKYYSFFVENLNSLSGISIHASSIIMPVGISFYTFQQLSFLIDRCRGEAPSYSFIDYFAYALFFPKITEGPIAYHSEIISQLQDKSLRHFDSNNFTRGLSLFIMGLGKKVLLADTLSLPVNYGFEQTYYLDTITTIFVLLAYTFELYFDFSGYCDMACGISRMLGIRMPANFNSPYKSASPKELWQRWHCTLTRFFIKYVYIPLGGSRKGRFRLIINIMIVFILSGLWHGAGWTYICWGIMQGLLVIWSNIGVVQVRSSADSTTLSNAKPSKTLLQKPLFTVSHTTGVLFTFIMFMLSLIFFRSQDLSHAFGMFRRLTYFTWPGFLYRTAGKLSISETYILREALSLIAPSLTDIVNVMIFAIILIISAFIITRPNAFEISDKMKFSGKTCLFLTVIFTWSLLSLSQVSTFIYFKY